MTIELFQKQTHINFVGKRYFTYIISCIIIALSLIFMAINGGISLGVDFSGGTLVQVYFEQPIEDTTIKNSLSVLDLPGLTIQQFGEDKKTYLIRFSLLEESAEKIKTQITQALHKSHTNNVITIQKLEMVGPKVGSDLRNSALEALYYAILLITVYISGRFEYRWMISATMAIVLGSTMYLMGILGMSIVSRVIIALFVTILLSWKFKLNFALGAIISLLYDIFITIGLLTIMNKEFDLNIIAALLTLIGYSLNDTIIVYDRIRENLQNNTCHQSLTEIINTSINQTLGRTIMTSTTTLVTVLSLLLLGGNVIHDFALTMFIGIVIGTLSSIFVASPILLAFGDIQQYTPPKNDNSYKTINEHGVV